MTDDELLRYSRQILLPQFGIEGQERLRASSALIVGLGGLGSPVAMYLAAAGIGRLLLADFDAVDLSNLQRQILHTSERIGQSKVASAITSLQALNPDVELIPVKPSLTDKSLPELVGQVDIVIDGSDNFPTRFAVNRACVTARVPLVSGAAIRMEGQVTCFSGQPGGPCYRCLYPDDGSTDETCSANGILAPVVGIIGSIQAAEAIKILTAVGSPLFGRLLLLDALTMEWRSIRLPADPACPVCAG
ncbi:molybdopterin-synthase adenylyltransferase MoeB [Thiorhodococcus mannitoliphagus]|uniref:Molybdopterin-synthase adenylyltransferase n=1 Tax=Thiorhodococcus mannitoliphagus TaxID=329406 RepID=A0A6P1DYF1_9GAMM|nr:molybdopterin-synthase adenylyltransferase MoeB [Thiorhodococcus mannitoliphagus]NEX22113.1 molybdopterin-synthase adenylyltransferase MoeB [Thiorhodococcus mannitoliphagus]